VGRVRAGPGADWQELRWPAPLHDLFGVSGVEPSPAAPSWPLWPWLALLALLCLAPLLRRVPPPAVEKTAAERALSALAAADGFDALEAAVRRYLQERHGVGLARTAGEIEGEHPALGGVLRRCERARFGGPATAAELEDAASLARAAVAGEGQAGQKAKTG